MREKRDREQNHIIIRICSLCNTSILQSDLDFGEKVTELIGILEIRLKMTEKVTEKVTDKVTDKVTEKE